MRGSLVALVALPLLACDLVSTNPPDGPQRSEEEQGREEKLQRHRVEFQQRLDERKRDFEVKRDVSTFERYCQVVELYGSRAAEIRAGIDITPHEEVLLNGAGKQFVDALLADYATKKQRTPELRKQLKAVYASRIKLLRSRRPDSDAYKEDGIASLAVGYPEGEWEIGNGPWATDLSFLKDLEKKHGRKAVHALCRAALDRVLADDRRDKARQHYVLETCALEYGEWEADLAAWADARETKEFRRVYGPMYAEAAADIAAREAEQAAKKSGRAPSDKPLVMLISDCEKKIRVVIAEDPASAGGRRLTLDANEQMHERIRADQLVWLVDDKRKPLGHVTVTRYTSEIEFTCTDVIAR